MAPRRALPVRRHTTRCAARCLPCTYHFAFFAVCAVNSCLCAAAAAYVLPAAYCSCARRGCRTRANRLPRCTHVPSAACSHLSAAAMPPCLCLLCQHPVITPFTPTCYAPLPAAAAHTAFLCLLLPCLVCLPFNLPRVASRLPPRFNPPQQHLALINTAHFVAYRLRLLSTYPASRDISARVVVTACGSVRNHSR